MCRYFCIGFIDFMLKGKSLLDNANLISPDEKFAKMKRFIALFAVSIENLKNPKCHTSLTLVLSIIFSKCKSEDERIFKEKESIEDIRISWFI